MNLEQELINYYGKHDSSYVQGVVMDYIENNYKQKSYRSLYLSILKSHPHSWGFPDVSAIDTAADRFEISENKTIRKKKEKSEYKQDLSITEEEWKNGFSGLEQLKKIVKNDIQDRDTVDDDKKLDPEKMKEIKKELEDER